MPHTRRRDRCPTRQSTPWVGCVLNSSCQTCKSGQAAGARLGTLLQRTPHTRSSPLNNTGDSTTWSRRHSYRSQGPLGWWVLNTQHTTRTLRRTQGVCAGIWCECMSQHCCAIQPAYLGTHTHGQEDDTCRTSLCDAADPAAPSRHWFYSTPPDTVQRSSPGTAAKRVRLAAAAAGGPWQPRAPLPTRLGHNWQQQALLRPCALTTPHHAAAAAPVHVCRAARHKQRLQRATDLAGTEVTCNGQANPAHCGRGFFCCQPKITLRRAHQGHHATPTGAAAATAAGMQEGADTGPGNAACRVPTAVTAHLVSPLDTTMQAGHVRSQAAGTGLP